jgi:hypothetical protein
MVAHGTIPISNGPNKTMCVLVLVQVQGELQKTIRTRDQQGVHKYLASLVEVLGTPLHDDMRSWLKLLVPIHPVRTFQATEKYTSGSTGQAIYKYNILHCDHPTGSCVPRYNSLRHLR